MTNEKRDLILRALVKLEGKWPDGYTALIVSTDSNARWGAGVYQNFPHGIDRFDGVMKGSQSWLWVCIKSEFEGVLQELRDKAPEGAEYVALSDGLDNTCYYRDIEEDYYEYCYACENRWRENCGKPIQGPLIPLPKLTESEKWMPEVGQECEYTRNGEDWHVCKVLMYGSHTAFLRSHKEDENGLKEYSTPISNVKFRPLRTEAEIERERLYNEAKEICENADCFGSEYIFLDAIESLIEAGWRPSND